MNKNINSVDLIVFDAIASCRRSTTFYCLPIIINNYTFCTMLCR